MAINDNPVTAMLTNEQRQALNERGATEFHIIRIYWVPIVGIIAEIHFEEDEPESDTVRRRVVKLSPSGALWDEHLIDEHDLDFPG